MTKHVSADLSESRGSPEATPSSNSGIPNISQTPPTVLGKRTAELIDENTQTTGVSTPDSVNTPAADAEGLPPDDVRLWEDGYADRYYEKKFGVDPKDIEFRHKVASAYVEGVCWVLLYYLQGCPSWNWYYPYHYAPFATDFVDIGKMKPVFEQGRPFRPFEQLMGVLPAASNHAIPEPFRNLMTDEDSDILEFYPEDFSVDLNGKKFKWQGVALLPFIDETRLLTAMATKYPLLSEEEQTRNEPGKDVLMFSTKHPLYQEVIINFYSKRQGAPKYKLNAKRSEGLAGHVEKNESYLPSSSLLSPLDNLDVPILDEDLSVSVHYEMPRSHNVHKSMLLRGVQMPTPILDGTDIEETRTNAGRTGRGYGGAPLRDNGTGRGQKINYANPFAQHLNPNFNPAVQQRAPPPPHLVGPNGWFPPPPPGTGHGFPPVPPPPGIVGPFPPFPPLPPNVHGYQGGQGTGRGGQHPQNYDRYDSRHNGGFGGRDQRGNDRYDGRRY